MGRMRRMGPALKPETLRDWRAARAKFSQPWNFPRADCPDLGTSGAALRRAAFLLATMAVSCVASAGTNAPAIAILNPAEQGFFSKKLDCHGIPIKAHACVADEALRAAYGRLERMLAHLPAERERLAKAGAELHVIGRDQVTTDLPEWRHDKGVKLEEYHGLTRDERTRGMGGLLTSCGEENLLQLEKDRYRGSDICVHEFAHNIRNYGMTREARARFDAQFHRSLEAGHWLQSYAGSNPDEFFAELSMWYFGMHGERRMSGPKPADGPEGLKAYDPEAFALMDDYFRGRPGAAE
jgi:hypothetical protein